MVKAVAYASDDEAEIMQNQTVELFIPGLEQIGNERFRLEGVNRREIDWHKMREALHIEGPLSEVLADQIAAVVFRHDIAAILAERIVT